jgi:hypothetical protein
MSSNKLQRRCGRRQDALSSMQVNSEIPIKAAGPIVVRGLGRHLELKVKLAACRLCRIISPLQLEHVRLSFACRSLPRGKQRNGGSVRTGRSFATWPILNRSVRCVSRPADTARAKRLRCYLAVCFVHWQGDVLCDRRGIRSRKYLGCPAPKQADSPRVKMSLSSSEKRHATVQLSH